jgi:LysM repeat protein
MISNPKHRRAAVVAWPAAVAAVLLVSCGADDAAGPTRSTVDLSEESTAFVVRPPVTTTTVDIVVEDGVVAGSQDYVVQAGDYPLKVAEQFGVPLDDLVNFNGWASYSEFPGPGTPIRIPPGGKAQTAAPAASGEASTDTDAATESSAPAESIPDSGDNCGAGTYTIQEGDVPLRVATKFSVSVDELNAANAATAGYSSFYVGLEIVIPAKADC